MTAIPEHETAAAHVQGHRATVGSPRVLSLETPRRTRLYWLGVVLVGVAVLIPELLPCVDYPQHLALADVARRLGNPAAPEHDHFILNWFTYNALFHYLVAKLSLLIPIEVAGRVVVSAALVALGGGVLALIRTLGRPPIFAALFTPIIFSFSVGWGFVNYTVATTVAVFTLIAIARAIKRPSVFNVVAVGALGLLCAFAHVLTMIVLCILSTAMAPEVAWRASAKPGRGLPMRLFLTLLRMGVALAPLLIGAYFCIRVNREEYYLNPSMYKDPTLEGTAPPLWQKLIYFGAFASDLYIDGTDQILLIAGMTVAIVAAVVRMRARRKGEPSAEEPGEAPLLGPFIVATIAYFATPTVLLGTHLIFERLGQVVILGMVLAVPRFPARFERRAAKWALGIATAAGINTVLHTSAFAWETNDAARVIDDLPVGRKATSVIYEPKTHSYRNGTLTHLAAYYGARKHGDWSFGFGRYLSVPVRFNPGGQPPWPRMGWEFDGTRYNSKCGYARVYDLVIVKQPDEWSTGSETEPLLRKRLFGDDANLPKLLSHHGEFWAFDTKGIEPDGTY